MARDTPQGTAAANPVSPPPKRRRRALGISLGVLASIVLLVILAPTILSLSAFCRYAMGLASDSLAAAVSADSWRLSWFGPQEVHGLSVAMPDGKQVARAQKIVLDQGLISLLRDRTHLGAVHIVQAEVWLEEADAWRAALAAKAAKEAPPETREAPSAAEPPALPRSVLVQDLTAHSSDMTLRASKARLEDSPDKAGVLLLVAAWQVENAGRVGSGEASASIAGLRTDWRGYDALEVSGHVAGENLPLAGAIVLDPSSAPVKGGATLSGEADFRRTRSGDWTVQGRCRGTGASATRLCDDDLALDAFQVSGRVSRTGNRYDIEGFQFDSAVASAKADLTFSAADAAGPPSGRGTATVRADLAALAKMLPKTLQIPVDVKVGSGTFAASLQMTSGGGREPQQLRLAAEVTDLRGTREGKPIAISPVRLALEVFRKPAPAAPPAQPPEQTPSGAPAILTSLELKTLSLTGAFGTVEGRGRLESFSLDARLDLARAMDEIGRFVDLKDYGAAGTMAAHVESTGTEKAGIQLSTRLDLQNFTIALGGGRRWQEPQATLTAAGRATFDEGHRPVTLAVSQFNLASATARVVASGSYRRAAKQWVLAGTATAEGDIVRTAQAADLAMTLAGPAPAAAAKGVARDAGNQRSALRDLIGRLARLGDKEAGGRWRVNVEANRAADGPLAATVGAQVSGLVVPPADRAGATFRVAEAALSATVAYDETARACSVKARASSKDLAAQLADGLAWLEPEAAIDAAADLRWDDAGRLADLDASDVALRAGTVALAGKGRFTQGDPAWSFQGAANAAGDITQSARLAQVVMSLAGAGVPKAAPASSRGAEGIWPDSAGDLLARLVQASGADTKRQWRIQAQGEGAAGKGFSVTLADGTVTNLVLPLGGGGAAPLHIVSTSIKGTAQQSQDGPWHIALTGFTLTSPELAAAGTADATVPGNFDVGAVAGTAAVEANATLDRLAAMLRSLELIPAAPAVSGAANIVVLAETGKDRRLDAKVVLRPKNLLVAWPDGAKVEEAGPTVRARGTLLRDAKGSLAAIDVDEWSVDAGPGFLQGSAAIKKAGKEWAYRVTAKGEGRVDLLAKTITEAAGSRRTPPPAKEPAAAAGKENRIAGRWHLAGAAFEDSGPARKVELIASATDLVAPEAGKEWPDGMHLPNVNLDAAATFEAAGAIKISRAKFTGPGTLASAAGTLRLPGEGNRTIAADGTLSFTTDLAELAKILKPFGVLAEGSRLAGLAKLPDGQVASGADGLSGSGTLSVSNLDVFLADSKIAVKETQATVPLAVAHDARQGRWSFAVKGIQSETASGSAFAAITPAEKATYLEAQCDISCDGGRAQRILGEYLDSKTMALSGPWGVRGRLAGPLAAEGPWNQRIAGIEGSGALDCGTLHYDKLACGNGTIPWRIGGRRIVLGADPARPGRIAVAGGTANLAGHIDLQGSVARLVIPQPLRVLENVPLSDPGVQPYLKFASPVLAGSINPNGRLWADVDSLDLPLSGAAAKKGVGSGRFTVQQFQTTLTGPLATILGWYGSPTRTPVQTLGPVEVQLAGGYFTMKEHPVVFGPDTTLLLKGTIGMDESLNVQVNIPLTPPMLRRFGVPATAAPYLVGQRLTVAMTGTIEKPKMDDRLVAKRIGEMVAEAAKRRAIEEVGDWLKKQFK
jgi:hypothetical protein